MLGIFVTLAIAMKFIVVLNSSYLESVALLAQCLSREHEVPFQKHRPHQSTEIFILGVLFFLLQEKKSFDKIKSSYHFFLFQHLLFPPLILFIPCIFYFLLPRGVCFLILVYFLLKFFFICFNPLF